MGKSEKFTLLSPRTLFNRLDYLAPPFIDLFIWVLYNYIIINEIFFFFAIFLAIIQHIVFFFISEWSIQAAVFFKYNKQKIIEKSTFVYVEKYYEKESRWRRGVCPIIKTLIGVNIVYSITFNKKKFIYNKKEKNFGTTKIFNFETFEYYKRYEGLSDETKISEQFMKFGDNSLEIPEPTFIGIYKEHVVAPFFVFQIFCSALWILDEYWYYSLLSLVLLFFVEGIVVVQRLKTLQKIRKMRPPKKLLAVYRNKVWKNIDSTQLVPGDIVCLKRESKDGDNIIPCDMLIISGTCIVNESILTGESVPLMKEGIIEEDDAKALDPKQQKIHMLFGGTQIVSTQKGTTKPPNIKDHPSPYSVICYVTNTGFNTSQGKMIRIMLFSSERVTVESKETYVFLLILLLCAIFSSSYVLYHSLQDPNRSRYKLTLKCIYILTSVVPPELPMELSLAVNQSIISLLWKSIFCTEPFRIPKAGNVNICCFDKTGTLTADTLKAEGVILEGGQESSYSDIQKPDNLTYLTLGACHSLIVADKKIIGDEIEKVSFEECKWNFESDKDMIISKTKTIRMIIQKRYAFNSILRRMSVISSISNSSKSTIMLRVFSKGAPEAMKPLFRSVPEFYDSIYFSKVKKGFRILALGTKILEKNTLVSQLTRESVESDLEFCGFILMNSKIKPNTKDYLQELKDSGHRLIMITGDNSYTASSIAISLGIASESLIYGKIENNNINWIDNNDKQVDKLNNDSEICISGEVLSELEKKLSEKDLLNYINKASVFARVSAPQKDIIITYLNKLGNITLMCGDGTNDVGSLKKAHIGVALINKVETDEERRLRKLKTALARKEIMNQQITVEQGDACIAAPFTYKYQSIKSVLAILKQGRCTLVTTFQMYKVLALNSLLSAYTLSILYFSGVKNSDFQLTIIGLMIGVYFFGMTRTKPLKKLEPYQPPTTIFRFGFMLTIVGQFLIHLFALFYLTSIAMPYLEEDESLKPDADFKANILNTVCFLHSCLIESTTFAINQEGWPFMEELTTSSLLFKAMIFNIVAVFFIAYNSIPEIRKFLELTEYPNDEFKFKVIICLALELFLTFLIERILRRSSYIKIEKKHK